MAFRLYIVPKIGTGTKTDPFRPKYMTDGTLPVNEVWSSIDYGFEPWFFIGGDLSSASDVILAAEPDVIALPFDLSPNLTAGQVNNVQTKLEAINVPSGWVNATLTWLDVVRTVLGIFSYLQRYGFIYSTANGSIAPSLFVGGVTLNTQFGNLSQAVQDAMVAAAQSFNISTAGLTANTTLRAILKNLADNFQNTPYNFNGVII
jgi:hypothetical protein